LSVPALYNFGWGQFSLPLTLGILLAFRKLQQGCSFHSGLWLGIMAAIKYYPALFAFWYLVKRDWRALAGFAASSTVCFLLPALLLGMDGLIDFQQQTYEAALAISADATRNVDSQYIGHVLARLWPGLSFISLWLGAFVAITSLLLVW